MWRRFSLLAVVSLVSCGRAPVSRPDAAVGTAGRGGSGTGAGGAAVGGASGAAGGSTGGRTDGGGDAVSVSSDARDAGSDARCSAFTPLCTLNCPSDIGTGVATCVNGQWTCPSGGFPCACVWVATPPPPHTMCFDIGLPEPCVEGPYPSPVCGALCGNGAQDTCSFRLGTQASCPDRSGTEPCDGQDFGVETCQSQGYATGKLTCAAKCEIDTSTCDECLPPAPPVVRCGRSALGAAAAEYVTGFALTGSDAEIGVAWAKVNSVDFEMPGVSFARLSPNLDLLSSIDLEGRGAGTATFSIYPKVAVATLPAGWIVAILGEVSLDTAAIFFHAIDSQGRDAGRVTVDGGPVSTAPEHVPSPLLASRPGGGPLIVWQTATDVRASVIAADGRSATSPIVLPVDYGVWLTGASYVGGAFYIELTSQMGLGDDFEYRLFLQRIEPDGRATSRIEVLPGELAGASSLVAGAPDLRVVYNSSRPTAADPGQVVTYWRRLDGSGNAASSPVELARDPYNFGVYPLAVAVDQQTVVIFNQASTNRLRLVRIDGSGSVVTPARDFVAAPGFGPQAIARRGPDAVVGWLASPIRLARIGP